MNSRWTIISPVALVFFNDNLQSQLQVLSHPFNVQQLPENPKFWKDDYFPVWR
jgi:hypothetical protein